MSEIKPWPLFGYAPGGYLIQCIKCNTNHHTGDKRAIICGDCASVEAKSRIASLEKEIERMRSERAYIIGFNDGWESAHEQQPGDDSPFGEIAGFDPIDYALHYGGRCRDCADADGVCPSSGIPCDPSEARKAAGHVLKAWKYGIQHGYMDNPFAAAIRRIKPSEAEGREDPNV